MLSVVLYVGLLTALLGGLSLLRPFGLLGIRSRRAATDPSARRKFAVYWRFIYPGSAIIRHSMLAAIRRRAERESP
jgi:hypothetical protein